METQTTRRMVIFCYDCDYGIEVAWDPGDIYHCPICGEVMDEEYEVRSNEAIH